MKLATRTRTRGQAHTRPVLPQRRRRRRVQARDLRGLLHVAHAHRIRTPRLRNQDPNQATVIQVRHGVHQDVREILLLGVIRAPPDDCAVHDVRIIDVNELMPRLPFNRVTHTLIHVVIDVKLLHDRIGRKTQAHCHHAAPPINELALSVISTFTPSS